MSGSGTIQVLKRDGSAEPFSRTKLSAALARAIQGRGGQFAAAGRLAEVVDLYLRRARWPCVSSAAVLEMSLKCMRRLALDSAAADLEQHRAWRRRRRRRLIVRHGDGKTTCFDKSWLAEVARRSWWLSRETARIIAGEIEQELLAEPIAAVSRERLVERLNDRVAAYGLVDAVPAGLW